MTRYLGPVWEYIERPDGKLTLTKLHLYLVHGERRFALTEADARAMVAAAGGAS